MKDTTNARSIAIRLIFHSEGCRLRAYLDSVARPPVWTIGHGTTRINGRPVPEGMTCTVAEADAWALDDARDATNQILHVVTVTLDDYQLGALISLVYNIGIGAFRTSSVLEALNRGLYTIAANRFLEYDHAGGHVVSGLVTRRDLEREVFLTNMDHPKAALKPAPKVAAMRKLIAGPPQSEADKLNARELLRIKRQELSEADRLNEAELQRIKEQK